MKGDTVRRTGLAEHGLVEVNCQYDEQVRLDTVTVVLDLQHFDCPQRDRQPRIDSLADVIYDVRGGRAVIECVPRFSNWRRVAELLDVAEAALKHMQCVTTVTPWREVYDSNG